MTGLLNLRGPVRGGLRSPVLPVAREISDGPGYDADAAAYFDRATITDTALKGAISAFVAARKAAGNWDGLVALWLLRGNQSEAAALKNIKSSSFNATAVGAPSWSAANGFAFNGSSQWLNLGIAPNNAALSQNLVQFGCGVVAAGTGNTKVMMGSTDGASYSQFYRDASNVVQVMANDSDAGQNSGTNLTGHLALARFASNNKKFYRNSAQVSTGTAASSTPNSRTLFLAAQNNGSAGVAPDDGTYAYAFVATFADVAATIGFQNGVEALLDALGVGLT